MLGLFDLIQGGFLFLGFIVLGLCFRRLSLNAVYGGGFDFGSGWLY